MSFIVLSINAHTPIFAATQCVGSCCVTCSNTQCTHIISASPCNTHCDGPTQHGCGGGPAQPTPTPRPQACTPNATRCSGCDRVRCLSDGSGETVIGRGACCTNPTSPPSTPRPPTPPPNNPPTVSITSPSNGSLFDPNQTITITATASDSDGSVTQVDFMVDGVSVEIDNTAPYAIDYTTPTTGGNKTITARARDDDGAFGNSAPVTITIRPTFTISGTVYEDNENHFSYNLVSGRCESPSGVTLPPVQPGNDSRVIHSEGESASVSSSGTFTLDAFGKNFPSTTVYPLTLQNFDTNEFRCSCPEGCTLAAAVGPNQTGVNFYVSRRKDPWLQVSGGDVHAQGRSLSEVNQVINNPVPETCEEEIFCKPFSLISSVPSQITTSGLLSYYQGVIDTWGDAGNQVHNTSEGYPNRLAKTNFPDQLSYRYFVRLAGLGFNVTSDFANPTNAPQPVLDPDKTVYYHNGNMTINSSWNIPANQSLVIFVGEDASGEPGNLQLGPNARIQVAQGGFLAFIVSGDITIDTEVGSTDPSTGAPTLTGFFIASNKIIIQGHENDLNKQLVVAGSMIGINGVELNRDFNSLNNNHYPVIAIKYRPDLVLNAPAILKRSSTTWRALAP